MDTFYQLFEQSISRSELNRFIEFCCQIAHQYVLIDREKIKSQIKIKNIDTFDIAVRAVSPFFILNKAGEFNSLKRAFTNWSPTITSEDTACFFLNKVIQKKTRQLLNDTIKESNPAFSKTLDSISYYLPLCGLKKYTFRGKSFVVKGMLKKAQYRFIQKEEFDKMPVAYFTEDEMMFKKIFSYLRKRKYTEAVPLYTLVWRIMEINSVMIEAPQPVDDLLSKQSMDEILEAGFQYAIKKLEESYIKKKKLNKKESFIFRSALKDMADDLKFNGSKRMLYDYLKPYFKNLTTKAFDVKYRNAFEYLDKCFRKKMAGLYDI